MYNTVLSYILSNYGTTDEFKSPDFEEKFSQFTKKTPESLKEVCIHFITLKILPKF